MVMKSFAEYNEACKSTDMTFDNSDSLFYLALGISGEAGEVADHVKKSIRDDGTTGSNISPKRRELILKELGDTMWYMNKMARVLGSSLDEVAKMNIDKLKSRLSRDKLHGSGDDR